MLSNAKCDIAFDITKKEIKMNVNMKEQICWSRYQVQLRVEIIWFHRPRKMDSCKQAYSVNKKCLTTYELI